MPSESVDELVSITLADLEWFMRQPRHWGAWVKEDRALHADRIALGAKLGHTPWICTICGRAPSVPDTGLVKYYACEICIQIDQRAGLALGHRMLLPLYVDERKGVFETVLEFDFESRTPGEHQIADLLRHPQPLLEWRDQVLQEAVVKLGFEHRQDISVTDWMRMNEWSPEHCAADYVQVLLQSAPSIFDDDERLMDPEWLTRVVRLR